MIISFHLDPQENEPTTVPSDLQRRPIRVSSTDLLFPLDSHAADASSSRGALQPQQTPPIPQHNLTAHLPFGLPQSRILVVRNVEAGTSADEVRQMFDAFGELERCQVDPALPGCLVAFYDIRAATLAKHTLQGQSLRGLAMEVSYAAADEAEGTLLVACVDPSVRQDEVLLAMSRFGEVQHIRQQDHAGYYLCSFYDKRHAGVCGMQRTEVGELNYLERIKPDARSGGILHQRFFPRSCGPPTCVSVARGLEPHISC